MPSQLTSPTATKNRNARPLLVLLDMADLLGYPSRNQGQYFTRLHGLLAKLSLLTSRRHQLSTEDHIVFSLCVSRIHTPKGSTRVLPHHPSVLSSRASALRPVNLNTEATVSISVLGTLKYQVN